MKAPPAKVFDAFFRTPQNWLCRQAEIDLRVGGALRMDWQQASFEGWFAQIEQDATASVARFSWHMTGDQLPQTMVVVRAEAVDGNETALELEHYGFGVGEDWDDMWVGAARAWASYLKNLRAVLELGVDLREPDE